MELAIACLARVSRHKQTSVRFLRTCRLVILGYWFVYKRETLETIAEATGC